MAGSKRTRFDDGLLKQFAEGHLDPDLEIKLAVAIEKSPILQARVAAISGEGFPQKPERVTVAVSKGSSRSGATPDRKAADTVVCDSREDIPQELLDVPNYQVLKEIGRGGMSVVYAAKCLSMDRMEVLKVLNPQKVKKASSRQRFINEIKAIGKLDHPFIAKGYHRIDLPSQLVFSMEYVPGQDLDKFIQQCRPVPVPIACMLASQIASALQHAHLNEIVHRDIKPSNVMVVDKDGQRHVKILDFGLAKATSEQQVSGLTVDGAMLGTPEYMAPEQAHNASSADIRADIYSLGCTLYHLLMGKPPFTGTYQSVLLAHAKKELPAINLKRQDVPVELARVVAKMMAKEPKQRHQSPEEVVTALQPFVEGAEAMPSQQIGDGVIAPEMTDQTKRRSSSSASRSTKPTGRRKLPAAAIVASGLFAALICFGIVFNLSPNRSQATPPPTAPLKRPASDFAALFNGSDLTGWSYDGTREDLWRVEKGEMIGEGYRDWKNFVDEIPLQLRTEQQYGDFEMEVEIKLEGEPNSGIVFRRDGEECIELELRQESLGKLVFWGARRWTFKNVPSTFRMAEGLDTRDWFTIRMRCLGQELTVWLNGNVVSTARLPSGSIESPIAFWQCPPADARTVIRSFKIVRL